MSAPVKTPALPDNRNCLHSGRCPVRSDEAETDDAKRWVDLIQKYSAIDELTAPLLNELIEKITVHQWRKDENGKKVWDIEIYYRFVGKID